jgi:hypothetical protein
MLDVKCTCCGETDSDDGSGGPQPFEIWRISGLVAPSLPRGTSSTAVASTTRSVHLCQTCRALLFNDHDFTGLAARSSFGKAQT